MKALFAMIVLLVVALGCPRHLEGQAQNPPGTNLTGRAILDGLKTKRGDEMHGFITFLDDAFDRSRLSDEEIDEIVEQLVAVQKSDPYQKTVNAFKDPAHRKVVIFPNRVAAERCILRFRCQKEANVFRRLPMDQRVDKLIEGIENQARDPHFDAVGCFSRELVTAGKDAVPFIVQHKPKEPYYRRAVVGALAAIGDLKAIDYIIEVLNTTDDSFRFERPIAAKALAKFHDRRAVTALVRALQDETQEEIDRHMPQVERPGHKPYIGRYFSVQHAAAESLTEITGKDWGLLYNEDYHTWLSWQRSPHPETFTPDTVNRSALETGKLVSYLFHRYMSARPNPWQPENALATAAGVRSLAVDLKELGPSVVSLIVNEYQARVKETPLWHEELREWTRELLRALDWNQANEAARSLT